MTTIENLEFVKATLTEKRDAIEATHSALEKEAREEKKAIFEKLFADELVSYVDVVVTNAYNGILFSVDNKEIASIGERNYWRGNEESKLYFSTYSTTCESEFEFRRLIFNGRIAARMLSDMDSIKEALATPFSKKDEMAALAGEYEILTQEIREKESQIRKILKEDFLTKLHGEGVEFTLGKSFQFSRQWSSYQVRKVRVIRTTKSGKTADLEVAYGNWDWVYDDEGNSKRVEKEDRIVTHEAIKMDYVLGNFYNQLYN